MTLHMTLTQLARENYRLTYPRNQIRTYAHSRTYARTHGGTCH